MTQKLMTIHLVIFRSYAFLSSLPRRAPNARWLPWALVALLAAAVVGCSKPSALPPDTPPPDAAPSAFWKWCQSEKFAVKSPQTFLLANPATKMPSAEPSLLEYRGWTACKSAAEARKFLEETFARLRQTAVNNGCTAQDVLPHGSGLALGYRCGRNEGTLVGRCVLDDSNEGGKKVKAHFIELKLTETVAISGDHS